MMAKNVLIENLSEPCNSATAARVDIHAGDGNMSIDRLTGGEPLLASGTLEYTEGQGVPAHTLVADDGQTSLTLRGGSSFRPRFRFPWSACNSETNWQIHLNPDVSSDITARSAGGNLKLNLKGMAVTRVSADTGGGNVEVVLPDGTADLGVDVKTGGGNVSVTLGNGLTGNNIVKAGSGAGNVVVHMPLGIPTRIHATTGLGKVIVDPEFSKSDVSTFQSTGFDNAADKVEITLSSGAGNVIVDRL